MLSATLRKTLLFIIPSIIFFSIYFPEISPGFGEKEFVAYWSATRLMVKGENPYDQGGLKALESAVRPEEDFNQGLGLPVWNPPWLMLILIPFGFFPFTLAARIWIGVNIAIFGTTMCVLWEEFFHPPDGKGYAWVLVASFLFFETLALLYLGQITALVLISLIAGIWFIKKGQDMAGGALIFFTTIKPHLTYLVLILLVFWAIRNRRWKVFLGMFAVFLLSGIIFSLILPNWLSSYIELHRYLPYQKQVMTTVGGFASIEFGTDIFKFAGLLLLPLIFPLTRMVEKEDWITAINIGLVLSVPLSPYGFVFDEVVLLPAIAQLVFWVVRRKVPVTTSAVTILFLLIIYFLRYSSIVLYKTIPYHLLVWQPLALCLLYMFAWKAKGEPVGQLQTALR